MCKEFNEALANLFYAVAAADKEVHKKERARLTDILRSRWINSPMYRDLEQIEKVFDELAADPISANESFEFFVNYKETHPEQFNHEIQVLVWSSACATSIAYVRNNRSEPIILSKLRSLFLEPIFKEPVKK